MPDAEEPWTPRIPPQGDSVPQPLRPSRQRSPGWVSDWIQAGLEEIEIYEGEKATITFHSAPLSGGKRYPAGRREAHSRGLK